MGSGWLGLLLCFALACSQRQPPTKRPSAYDAYRRPEQLMRALQVKPGEVVAEVGAGGGYLTVYLAQAVGATGRVVATDIDDTALTALRQRTRSLPQVEARRVQPHEPGLAPGRYDLILLAQVDHLLPDRAAYLRLLLGALKPGGRLALSNSSRHRQGADAALAALGLPVAELDAGLPEQFVLVVRLPPT